MLVHLILLPAPGIIASFVSVKPIFALLAAILKSQAKANSSPPPIAWPSNAAIVGIDRLLSSLMPPLALDTNGATSSGLILALSFKSAPAQNMPEGSNKKYMS